MLKKGDATRVGRFGEGGGSRKGERKSFFCQEKLFHIYRRGIPCACTDLERVGQKKNWGMKHRGMHFSMLECAATYVEMTHDLVRLLDFQCHFGRAI